MIITPQQSQKYLRLLNADSLLHTKPLKKLPDIMVYNKNRRDHFVAFNKQGKQMGYMIAYPVHVSNPDTFYKLEEYISFFIKRLFINKEYRGQGAGTALLNAANKLSCTPVCEGRVHLIAKKIFDAQAHPQKFYRKAGFDSQRKCHIERIDWAIKNNKPLPSDFLWETPMFLNRKIHTKYTA